jgi:tetratricopeptide (TPR) repeat protein
MSKYVPGGETTISITPPQVAVAVPFGSTAAALALAEVYQSEGRREEAIGILQQLVELHPQTALVLSLAELLAEVEAWDELAELTAGTKNEDDATLATCVLQARALEHQGPDEAALEVYRDALRSKKRSDELLKRARYGRGRLYLKLGKRAQGRKDLARVYADDPGFENVAELLQDA